MNFEEPRTFLFLIVTIEEGVFELVDSVFVLSISALSCGVLCPLTTALRGLSLRGRRDNCVTAAEKVVGSFPTVFVLGGVSSTVWVCSASKIETAVGFFSVAFLYWALVGDSLVLSKT